MFRANSARLSGVGFRRISICSLWIRPGARQLIVIPCRPISRESPLAQAWTPALAATAALTVDGSALPVTQRMRPHRRSIMAGKSAWVVLRTAGGLREDESSPAAAGGAHRVVRDPPAFVIRVSTRA